jgi:hypothetical protein
LQVRALPGADQVPERVYWQFNTPKIEASKAITCQSPATFGANPLDLPINADMCGNLSRSFFNTWGNLWLLGEIIMALFALLFYFLPTSLAAFRRRKKFPWILGVNLLLGWTVIGWIVAFIWAFVGKPVADPKPRSKAMSFAYGALVALGIIAIPVILANAPKVSEQQENKTATSSETQPATTPGNERQIGEEFKLGDYTYRIIGFTVRSSVGSQYSQETAGRVKSLS